MTYELHLGDMTHLLPEWAADGMMCDSCVTDPPYHLTTIVKRFGKPGSAPAKIGSDGRFSRLGGGFMGAIWDGGEISFRPETWRAVYDVLKPGAFLLAFAGARTFHRIGCAIEDAGFWIHPCLFWAYGQGFCKSHDAARAIDKLLGKKPRVVEEGATVRRLRPGAAQARDGTWEKLDDRTYTHKITEAVSDEAAAWQGWGYGLQALTPGVEPIIMAQKPFSEKTGAANLLRWGVGALNIDASRIPFNGDVPQIGTPGWGGPNKKLSRCPGGDGDTVPRTGANDLGRWPKNLLHDGSDEVVTCFPDSPGQLARARTDGAAQGNNVYGALRHETTHPEPRADQGSAARFFMDCGYSEEEARSIIYCSKAGRVDRAGSGHPTVKPQKLLQYLVRMVTPPGGVVLDPFGGSGSTVEACEREGFNCVYVEKEKTYYDDTVQRMALWRGAA